MASCHRALCNCSYQQKIVFTVMQFLNLFYNIYGIFAEISMEKKVPYRYCRYFLKNVPLSVTSLYFKSKVSVPISSLLLKYRVPTSANRFN